MRGRRQVAEFVDEQHAALGLFAGSGTSTATLQAIIAALHSDGAAVGYSVAYPFGVAGPILFLYIALMVLKPKIAVPTGTNVIEAARLVNVDVPHYCYHPKLTIVGNCRMCLIEMGLPAVDPATKAPIMDPATGKQKINWIPRPQIGCGTNVSPGLHVKTTSPMVKDARDGRYVLVNRAAEEMRGAQAAALLGRLLLAWQAFADGELSNRCALSIARRSDSFW